MSSNKRKTDFLGIPHGTAMGRLRKQILFSLLQKCKENFCFRCKEEIVNVSELTIDHKEPWQGIDANLFWDLNTFLFLTTNVTDLTGKKAAVQRKGFFRHQEWLGALNTKIIYLERLSTKAADATY